MSEHHARAGLARAAALTPQERRAIAANGGARVDIEGHGKTSITRAVKLDEETAAVRVGKRRAGRLLDGREHNGMPTLKGLQP